MDAARDGTRRRLRSGSVIGGLLNVTFGNMAELILALIVLRSGNLAVFKATITGSIIGNSLLGLGLAIVVGSFGREKQTFNRAHAGLLSSLLLLTLVALFVPAVFDYTERSLYAANAAKAESLDEMLSLGVAVVLIGLYVANLCYTLYSHKDIFAPEAEEQEHDEQTWSLTRAIVVLLAATVAVAIEAEFVSDALESTAQTLGLSTFFMGVMVLPLVSNAAEYFSALYFARKDRMGLVMGISVGASIQVALLTAPLLVHAFASQLAIRSRWSSTILWNSSRWRSSPSS